MEATLRKVDSLLAHAYQLPDEDRTAYLEQACGTDTALRQEIEDLLAVDSEILADLEKPVFELISTDPEAAPSQLGPYVLEQEIGRGGTAIVYRAHPADEPSGRPVAIKMLQYGASPRENLDRLRREGEILAKLRHPNIARVYGGGIAADGRPYLVMELVQGETISQYCDRLQLTIHQRVRLFLPLLSAIRYAHSKLVVHRDLKPDNILVTPEGMAKVLDFGVAKLLDRPEATPGTLTVYGLRMVTPEYAAPEQLAMAPVSTTVDVYSLGVVLYELFTGRRPFERADDPSVFLHRVQNERPKPPSSHYRHPEVHDLAAKAAARRDTPARLAHLLRHDLDSVVLLALRKAPTERYLSVDGLERDLVDFLENRPVRARRGRIAYRLGKALRRHRKELLTAALILAAAAGWLLDREASRRQLIDERNKAAVAQDFMEVVLTNADPFNRAAGIEATVESIMEHARGIVDLEGVPEFEAELLKSLARIYGNRGDSEKSSSLIRESLALSRQVLPPSDPRIARTEVLLADSLHFEGKSEEAVNLLEQALESYEKVPDPDGFDLAAAHSSLLQALLGANELEEAEALAEQTLSLIDRLPQNAKIRSLRFQTMFTWGALAQQLSKLALAEDLFDQVWRGAVAVWGQDDARSLQVHGKLAAVIFDRGRHDEGITMMQQVVDRLRDTLGQHRDLGYALKRLGIALTELGRIEAARPVLHEAVAVLDGVLGPEHAQTLEARAQLDALTAGLRPVSRR